MNSDGRQLHAKLQKIRIVICSSGDMLAERDAAAGTCVEASHDIFECLAQADPGNAGWQRDHSVSHEKIGTALRESLKANERIALLMPDHMQAQRAVAVSHFEIAETLLAAGRAAGALQDAGRAVALVRTFAARFPGPPQWQADRNELTDLPRRINAAPRGQP